jgi:hypothetical protein
VVERGAGTAEGSLGNPFSLTGSETSGDLEDEDVEAAFNAAKPLKA